MVDRPRSRRRGIRQPSPAIRTPPRRAGADEGHEAARRLGAALGAARACSAPRRRRHGARSRRRARVGGDAPRRRRARPSRRRCRRGSSRSTTKPSRSAARPRRRPSTPTATARGPGAGRDAGSAARLGVAASPQGKRRRAPCPNGRPATARVPLRGAAIRGRARRRPAVAAGATLRDAWRAAIDPRAAAEQPRASALDPAMGAPSTHARGAPTRPARRAQPMSAGIASRSSAPPPSTTTETLGQSRPQRPRRADRGRQRARVGDLATGSRPASGRPGPDAVGPRSRSRQRTAASAGASRREPATCRLPRAVTSTMPVAEPRAAVGEAGELRRRQPPRQEAHQQPSPVGIGAAARAGAARLSASWARSASRLGASARGRRRPRCGADARGRGAARGEALGDRPRGGRVLAQEEGADAGSST